MTKICTYFMTSLKNYILESLGCNDFSELSISQAKKLAKRCKTDASLDSTKTAFEYGADKINWWKGEKGTKILLYKENALISCKKYDDFVYVFEAASFEDSKTKGIFSSILEALSKYMHVKSIVWQASDGGTGKLSKYYESLPNVKRLPKNNPYSDKADRNANFLWSH